MIADDKVDPVVVMFSDYKDTVFTILEGEAWKCKQQVLSFQVILGLRCFDVKFVDDTLADCWRIGLSFKSAADAVSKYIENILPS
jgi:hypothetical protein